MAPLPLPLIAATQLYLLLPPTTAILSLCRNQQRSQERVLAGVLAIALLLFLLPATGALFPLSACRPYVLDGLAAADCSSLHVVNSYNLHLDETTEVLDLSRNAFTTLRGNEFQDANLRHLVKITARYNQISQVDSLAFNGLFHLRHLDLSHNQIKQWELSYLPNLATLNLSHNPLNQHFYLSSSSLQVLDISHCGIGQISKNCKLPHLEHWNVSFNEVEVLPRTVVQAMPLQSLQIQGNPIYCGAETNALIQWLLDHSVNFGPVCLSAGQVWDQPPPPPPYLQPTHDLVPWPGGGGGGEQDRCSRRVEQLQLEQRQYAAVTLALHGVLVLTVLAALGLWLCWRRRDQRAAAQLTQVELPLEDAPPPPYRTYLSGFSV